MKKILFPLLQSNKGGNILSTISICNKINTKKFKSYILLITKKNKSKSIERYLPLNNRIIIDKIYLDNNNKLFNLYLYFKLFKYLLQNSFDIVHTNDGVLNFKFSILCLIFRIDHILHLRNTDNSRRNYISYFFSKKIICISKYIKNGIPQIFNKKKIVLYNYVEFFNKKINLKKKDKKFLIQNNKKFFLLFVSNIHKRKNPKVFVDIIYKLNEKIDNKFIGLMFFQSDKNEFKKILNYIKFKNMEKKIFLYRNYPLHYWVKFVEKIKRKMLIATSENEPLGRNIIEGVLKNIFVIANNSGGHKEIIDRSNGVLIDGKSTKKLINYVNHILFNINKKSKTIKLKKYFISKFQDKNYINKIEKIYLNEK